MIQLKQIDKCPACGSTTQFTITSLDRTKHLRCKNKCSINFYQEVNIKNNLVEYCSFGYDNNIIAIYNTCNSDRLYIMFCVSKKEIKISPIPELDWSNFESLKIQLNTYALFS